MKNLWFLGFVAVSLSASIVVPAQEPDALAQETERWAQEQRRHLARLLEIQFERIRTEGTWVSIPDAMLAEDPEFTLRMLSAYEDDESSRVRTQSVWQARRLALLSRGPFRQEAVSRLVRALQDPDVTVWRTAARHLKSFQRSDFTDESKAIIHRLLSDDHRRLDIIWVVGAAGMREELPRLKSLLVDESKYMTGFQSGKWWASVSWAARLARARMGVQEDVQRAIELVELEQDPTTRVTRLLRHLAYTRQPAAFESIAKYLESEERLPPLKSNDPGTSFVQYAMDVLAENLPGFPAKRHNIGAHTGAEIVRAREWINKRTLLENE